MARPKGAKNKTDEIKAAVARIEKALVAGGHKGGLEMMACRFLTSEDLKVASGVWGKLMEWKWGKPVQPQEHSAPGGEQLRIIVEHIGRPQDTPSAKTV